MLGYVTIGSNDLANASAFYEALFAPLGVKILHRFDRGIFFGQDRWEVAVVTPHNGAAATVGNGAMIALQAPSRAVVDEVYALALHMGGSDEGAPGIRGRAESGFYGAYFRDPEGNKLCLFHQS